jgi:hypothetical protein
MQAQTMVREEANDEEARMKKRWCSICEVYCVVKSERRSLCLVENASVNKLPSCQLWQARLPRARCLGRREGEARAWDGWMAGRP